VRTIYWAILLDEKSKAQLLSKFPPIHTKIFTEHCTIAFRPDRDVDEFLMEMIGRTVDLRVVGYAEDQSGQAVVVESDIKRMDDSVAHITISCADGIKPVYSNKLIRKYSAVKEHIVLSGCLARYTINGWVKE